MENIQSKESGEAKRSFLRRPPKGSKRDSFVRFFKKNGAGFIFALPVTLGLLFFYRISAAPFAVLQLF